MENTKSLNRPITFLNLFLFALPTVLSNVFMSIYGVVDGFFAANYIGTDALACVNIAFPVIMISLLIGIMLGTGGNALVARKLGEGKEREAKEDFTLLMVFGVAVTILLCVLIYFFRVPIAYFLGADDSLIAPTVEYIIPIVILLPPTIPGTILEMFIITVGKPQLGLAFSVAGGLTNIFLDWLLIAKLNMGLTGAAVATSVGYIVPSVLGVALFLFNRRMALYFVRPKWRPDSIRKSCVNGASEMVGIVSGSIIAILLNNIVIRLSGADGVAAVSVILYAQSIFMAIFMGYCRGISPIISYNYGKQDQKKLTRSYMVSFITTLILSVLCLLVCLGFAAPIVRIFARADSSPVVYTMATHGFRIFSVSVLFSGINILVSSLFTALNDGVTSAILSFCRSLVFTVPMILLFSFLFRMEGIWWSMPAVEFLSLLLSLWYLRKLRAPRELN